MSSEVKLIEDWREHWEPKDGRTIIAVADTPSGVRAWARLGNDVTTYREGEILIPKPRPKTYRPWKREEVPVGSVVRSKNDACVQVITSATDSYVGLGQLILTREEMFDRFVLHRTTESGEWLPVEQCPKCGVDTGSLEIKSLKGE